MRPERSVMAESYTVRAGRAVLEAAQSERDFAGWLASVLATAAAELGSTGALTTRRPGSWEAELVQRLVKGTVGWNDEYLSDYKQTRSPQVRGQLSIDDGECGRRRET
jgi:hypothetical protein